MKRQHSQYLCLSKNEGCVSIITTQNAYGCEGMSREFGLLLRVSGVARWCRADIVIRMLTITSLFSSTLTLFQDEIASARAKA